MTRRMQMFKLPLTMMPMKSNEPRRGRFRICRGSAFWVVSLVASLVAGLSASAEETQALGQVLARFDEVQGSIRTLSARFTETTTNTMLKDPIVAEGRFYMTKPDSIRWEYSTPEEMRFVIARDEYTGYFPARKQAERRNVQRWSDHLFRFFGLGQGSTELAKFYRIQLGEEDEENVCLLLLEPKKRRARKRIEEVRFYVDESTYLPRRVEYQGADGNGRVIEFDEISINPDLGANLYEVELPNDVEITKGFSGLPNFNPDSVQ